MKVYNTILVALSAVTSLIVTSCGYVSKTSNEPAYGVDVRGDTLIINASRSVTKTLSYSILGKPFVSKSFTSSIELDMLELIKEDKEHVNEYAYTIATTGNLPIRFTIGNQLDTTMIIPIQVSSAFAEKETKIISGPCLKLGLKRVSNSQEVNIKKWLFNRGTHADEATIHKMAQVVNFLTSSSYDEYIYEEGKEIPVLSSFKDAQYKITTDIQADFYYLFAATEYSEINDFIAEVVAQNFQYAEKNPSVSFSCFRPTDKGGLLTIFLIAINNDWTRTVIPLGVVAIDNIKPSIISDNTSAEGWLNNALNNTKQTTKNNQNFIKELNTLVVLPENAPIISGGVDISTGQFRGDNAQFTISFSGDVESMTIKREIHRSYSWLKPGTKTINFLGQTSPLHFTYELDLGIGDNYIPITVKDKRGNVSTYSYHIKMVQVEKTNPEINIDNNIDIWN